MRLNRLFSVTIEGRGTLKLFVSWDELMRLVASVVRLRQCRQITGNEGVTLAFAKRRDAESAWRELQEKTEDVRYLGHSKILRVSGNQVWLLCRGCGNTLRVNLDEHKVYADEYQMWHYHCPLCSTVVIDEARDAWERSRRK